MSSSKRKACDPPTTPPRAKSHPTTLSTPYRQSSDAVREHPHNYTTTSASSSHTPRAEMDILLYNELFNCVVKNVDGLWTRFRPLIPRIQSLAHVHDGLRWKVGSPISVFRWL